jgi:arginyl-tRNA synthetase
MKHDSLQNLLARPFVAAIAEITGQSPAEVEAHVRPSAKFGDYQCNAAMSLAKKLGAKPRDIAQRIKDAAEPSLAEIAEPLEIAGAGFINIHLKDAFLAQYLADTPAPPTEAPGAEGTQTFQPTDPAFDRLGMPPTDTPQTVVVDYSQPNIAKQMHVGHLRSTIIGDALVRVLGFEGHDVIRQNHIGDWGTQFGMLIRWYREHPLPSPETDDDVLEAIETDYKAANNRFKADAQFAEEARRAVVELQSGEPKARRTWELLCQYSWQAFTEIYKRLGVLLTPEDVQGESFYNEWLPDVIEEMRKRLPAGGDGGRLAGVRAEVRDDAGAVCVFLYDEQGEPLFKNEDGSVRPTIIQKSDGGYKYETTDLAALRYRIGTLGATRILYVVDVGQSDHFQRLFACAKAAGLIPPDVEAVHVKFGDVKGADGKRLRTREGGTVKLRELLDEAERRALELLESREEAGGDEDAAQSALESPDRAIIAKRIGIASVKYADLRSDRSSGYVFDWNKMITFQGNTAPYMMYAYARIRSIYRKAAEQIGSPDIYGAAVRIQLGEPAERALALRLARFRESIDAVASELLPHILCGYLYDLAGDFMRFYESCPVLKAPDEATRLSRMRLCDITARTLKLGLALLGITVIERM